MREYLDIYVAELSPAMQSLKDISPAQFINACNRARQDICDALENGVNKAEVQDKNYMFNPTAGRMNILEIDDILNRHGFALRIKELRWDYRYRQFRYPKGDLI